MLVCLPWSSEMSADDSLPFDEELLVQSRCRIICCLLGALDHMLLSIVCFRPATLQHYLPIAGLELSASRGRQMMRLIHGNLGGRGTNEDSTPYFYID
jgi:hypothetical protein